MNILPVKSSPVLGVRVSAVSLDQAVHNILRWIVEKTKTFVTVTGVHGIMEAQDDAAFLKILNSSGMTVPDGMPLVWLSWWNKQSHVTRVYGPDLTQALCEELAKTQKSIFYYGGAEGVATALAEAISVRFPGVKNAGTYTPPFRSLTPEEKSEVISRINAANADVVLVGLSTPKQERWMYEFRPHLNTPVLIGVGAVFDFFTGRVKQAPRWIQRSGFEWAYRLLREPKRLGRRYLKNNPRFIFRVLTSILFTGHP